MDHLVMTFCTIIAELWRSEVARRWKKNQFFRFLFGKTGKFQNSVPKGFIATDRRVVFKFSKTWPTGIGKVVGYLLKKNFAWLSSSRYCAYRAQNLPGAAPNNALIVVQNGFHRNRLTFGGVIFE